MNPLTGAAPIIDSPQSSFENVPPKKARYSPINTTASPGLQINHQHIPGTFTPGSLFNGGVSGIASPIHMGPMLSGGMATPNGPGRMGVNGLNVPQTPMGMMMNYGMGNMGYSMVSRAFLHD